MRLNQVILELNPVFIIYLKTGFVKRGVKKIMDKLIFDVPETTISKEGAVVKIDAEAAAMLLDIASKTGRDKKYIVSEMIKFSYPRTEVRRVMLSFKDICEKEEVE